MKSDRVTGYTGIATSRTEWINGCVRWGVQSQKLHEGKVVDAEVFDEVQLEIINETPVAATGGDRPTIRRETVSLKR